MPRRLAVILGFLILGAIINITVALGLALQRPFEGFVIRASRAVTDWPIQPPAGYPRLGSNGTNSSLSGLRRELWGMNGSIQDTYYNLDHVSAGWPMLALHGGRWWCFNANSVQAVPDDGFGWAIETSINPLVYTTTFHQGFYTPGSTATGPTTTTSVVKRLVPFHPLFPGFAINTLFYAAICWLMFAAPFAFRRALRRRRGLCAECAYPIGTNERCTECGAALTPASEPRPSGSGPDCGTPA